MKKGLVKLLGLVVTLFGAGLFLTAQNSSAAEGNNQTVVKACSVDEMSVAGQWESGN